MTGTVEHAPKLARENGNYEALADLGQRRGRQEGGEGEKCTHALLRFAFVSQPRSPGPGPLLVNFELTDGQPSARARLF
jgi:hypothetical protein